MCDESGHGVRVVKELRSRVRSISIADVCQSEKSACRGCRATHSSKCRHRCRAHMFPFRGNKPPDRYISSIPTLSLTLSPQRQGGPKFEYRDDHSFDQSQDTIRLGSPCHKCNPKALARAERGSWSVARGINNKALSVYFRSIPIEPTYYSIN
jgi:hypothetical protein